MIGPAVWLDMSLGAERDSTYLNVITLVIVTTLAEEPMMYNTVNIELIQQGIPVLETSEYFLLGLQW